MTTLSLGILLWIVAHIGATLRIGFRASVIAKLGENKYRGVFSLIILTSLALIVFGWRSTDSVHIYDPPLWNSPLSTILMAISFALIAGAGYGGNVRRFIRHPQMAGVFVWAGGHLLANGDNRSLVLFGAIGVWAILEMILLSRREGAWTKPDPTSLARELTGLLATAVVFVLATYFHHYYTGMEVRLVWY